MKITRPLCYQHIRNSTIADISLFASCNAHEAFVYGRALPPKEKKRRRRKHTTAHAYLDRALQEVDTFIQLSEDQAQLSLLKWDGESEENKK
jgi:hypothetical protein